MEKGKIELTQKDAENTPAGGVVVGKRDGQTMIYDDASLGGYFVGKLHKDGGIKMINKSTGQPLEVQGSEIIITAPAVNDQTKREFEGKMMTNREILSKINSDGGGVSFADGGDIPAKIHTTDCEYKFGGKVVKDTDIAHSLGMNSTLKKGKQQFSSGDTTYDVDAIYNAIKKGKLRLKTKEVETFPMKYPVYDKKYSETVKTDFRKPNGITVRTESGEEVLIDGNHRINNAYSKGRKTMKTYYIEDPKQISKFSKKNKFELGGENIISKNEKQEIIDSANSIYVEPSYKLSSDGRNVLKIDSRTNKFKNYDSFENFFKETQNNKKQSIARENSKKVFDYLDNNGAELYNKSIYGSRYYIYKGKNIRVSNHFNQSELTNQYGVKVHKEIKSFFSDEKDGWKKMIDEIENFVDGKMFELGGKNNDLDKLIQEKFSEGYGVVKHFELTQSGGKWNYIKNPNISRSQRDKMPVYTIETNQEIINEAKNREANYHSNQPKEISILEFAQKFAKDNNGKIYHKSKSGSVYVRVKDKEIRISDHNILDRDSMNPKNRYDLEITQRYFDEKTPSNLDYWTEEFKNGGHLSKGKSLKQIAEMHNVSLAHINEQLAKGLEVEKEHFADFKERTRVAKDHLVENPNYYTILAKAGLKRGGKIEKEDLVKDAKDGNTPARDLNNYNDLMDVQADGEVGGDSGIEMDGALVTGDTGAVDAFADGGIFKGNSQDKIVKGVEVTNYNSGGLKEIAYNPNELLNIFKNFHKKIGFIDTHFFVTPFNNSGNKFKAIGVPIGGGDFQQIIPENISEHKLLKYLKGKYGGLDWSNFIEQSSNYAKGGQVNDDLWQSVKDKFSKIFWEEDYGDEIYANEVKAEERVWIFDRYSPYMGTVSWEDAKNMFLKSLTDEEKKIVNIEYNLREVSEAFGLMWEKKILVKRKKKLDEIDNLSDLLKFVEENYANGGLTPYDANTEGDSVDIVEDDFAKGGVVYDTTKPTVDKITIKETKFDGDSNLYSGLRENIVGKEATNISYFINLIKDYVGQNPLEETDWLTFYVNDGKKGTYYIDLNKGKKNTVKNVNPKTGGGDDIKRVIDANKYLAKNYNWTEFFFGQQTKKDNSVIRISVTYDSKVQGATGGMALKNNTLELYEFLRGLHVGEYVNVQIQPIGNSLGVNPVLLNLNTFSWDNLLMMSPQETALKEINRILYGLFPELNFDAFVRASSNATTSQTTTSTSNNDDFVDVVGLDYQLDAKNYFSVSCRNLKELLEDFAKIEYYCVKNPDATISVEITAEVTDNTGRITAKKERINIGKDAFKPSNFSYDEVKELIQEEWFDNQLDFANFFKTSTTAQTPIATKPVVDSVVIKDKDVVPYGQNVYRGSGLLPLFESIYDNNVNKYAQVELDVVVNGIPKNLPIFLKLVENVGYDWQFNPMEITEEELEDRIKKDWLPEYDWETFFHTPQVDFIKIYDVKDNSKFLAEYKNISDFLTEISSVGFKSKLILVEVNGIKTNYSNEFIYINDGSKQPNIDTNDDFYENVIQDFEHIYPNYDWSKFGLTYMNSYGKDEVMYFKLLYGTKCIFCNNPNELFVAIRDAEQLAVAQKDQVLCRIYAISKDEYGIVNQIFDNLNIEDGFIGKIADNYGVSFLRKWIQQLFKWKDSLLVDKFFEEKAPASTPVKPFDFTDTKIDVEDNPELSQKVQKRAFELGWEWENNGGKTIDYNDFNYLYFTKTSISSGNTTSSFTKSPKRKITEQDIFGNQQTPTSNSVVPKTKEKVMFLRGISNKLGADVSNVTELRKYIEDSYLADDKQKGKVTLNVGGDSSKGTFYISYGSTFSCSTCFDIQTDGNKRIQDILLSFEGADKFDWSDFFQEEKIIETGVSDLGEAIKKLEKASSKVATEYNRDAYEKSLKFLYDTKATYELALKFTPESAFMYERLDILKKLADLEKSIKKIEDMKKGGAFYMLAQILEKLQRGENWRTSENAQDVITNQLPQSEIDVIIRSQKFKNWFGDWEKALVNDEYDNVSKALTDGVPSVYHHGARRIKYTYREVSNGVLYLAENISYAIWFSQNSTAQSEEGNYLTDCFVNIKNPIDLTAFHVNQIDLGDLVRYIDAIYPLARIYDFIPAQVALLIKTNQPTNVRMWAWQLIRSYAKFVNHIKENTPYDGFLYYENNPSDQVINPVTGQSEENVTKAVAIFKSHQVKVVDAVLFDGGLDDWRFENGGKINN